MLCTVYAIARCSSVLPLNRGIHQGRETVQPSLHDDRHTAATLLLSENVHPRVVMELLGHSQMRTTMDIYSHVMPALAREAADRMGAILLTSKGGQTATRTATTDIVDSGHDEESPAQMGGAEGTRTPDPHTASVVRYQLRHSPLRPGLV